MELRFEKVTKEYSRPFHPIRFIGNEFSSNSPPAVFIGSKLPYPYVNVGILAPPERQEDAWLLDSPPTWASQSLTIKQILHLRSSLINSRFRSKVFDVRNSRRFLSIAQEMSIAAKPVEVDVELKKKLNFTLDIDAFSPPMGARAPLKNVVLTSNPKPHPSVEKVFQDTDLKAAAAITYLYERRIDEHHISKLLSVGILGTKKSRKLVPTRWGITATDDILAKRFLHDVKTFQTVDRCEIYRGNYLGNHYWIMLTPHVFSYELFELYLPGSAWNAASVPKAATDYESYAGRTTYAEQCAGGYYASRLPIVEHLHNRSRQASVLAIRLETPTYAVGLGVWVVREATRRAMDSQPLCFDTLSQATTFIANDIMQQFQCSMLPLMKKSKLLTTIKQQKTLTQFF